VKALNAHIYAGKSFLNYQKLFKVLKKPGSGTKLPWGKWLNNVVKISKSYVYRHIQMYLLVKDYPGLRQLSMSFTELFKKKDRISSLFLLDQNLAQEWQ